MNSVEVLLVEGKIMTSSKNIAEVFEKRHDNVLRKIDNILKNNERNKLIFQETVYKNTQNKNQRMYLLDEEFTNLLVMSFNGHKAIDFKMLYTKEFIKMRNLLNSSVPQPVQQPVQPVVPTNLIEALELSVKILKEKEQLQLTLDSKESELAISEEIIDDLTNVKGLYTRRETAKKLNLKSSNAFCKWLRTNKYTYILNGSEVPYASAKELIVIKSVLVNDRFYDNIYITAKGFEAIAKRLKAKNELEIC